MSFSYLPDSPDPQVAAIARVRLEIGDTTEDVGVLPDGGNLSNEEIALFLRDAGGDVPTVVRMLAGTLARRWAVMADVSIGPRRESLSQVAQAWERQAQALGGAGGGAFVVLPVRVDGFSERAK